ncbi:MAG: beta-lactamase family protein [Goleter apudmare HA4340-LM2]|jgi:CubicO group peptidase (beta-lactamase class C family)|nr:beta-lactamase family protein [Goleter apudmare HA4340-LM2]
MQTTPMKLKGFTGLMLSVLLLGMSLNASAKAIAAPNPKNSVQNRYRRAAEYSEAHNGAAMVVVQSGQVVFESYPRGVNPEQGRFLASGTKSFSCAIAVLGVQDGLLRLDEPVAQTISEWKQHPQKSQITIRQLLNLTSGITGGESGDIPSYTEAIKQPLTAQPGQRYQYGPIPFQIFGEVMRRKLKARGMAESPLTYLDARILQPIGLKYDRWTHQNGQPNLPSGAVISAREWAKYGVLLLNRGKWQGRQLLNSQQLNQCFQGTTTNPAYGITFWLNKNGDMPSGCPTKPIGAASESMVMAIGAGNQVLFVLPKQNLVVVRQGRLNQQSPCDNETGGFKRERFLNLVLTGAN